LSTNNRVDIDALRLQSIVASHQTRQGHKVTELTDVEFSLGAAGIVGTIGWVLAIRTPMRGLGPALLWTNKHNLSEVNVVVESDAGVIARRASLFDLQIRVWSLVGNQLVEASASPIELHAVVPEHHVKFAELIEHGGATVVTEHGVLAGEVLGLEVCRVVGDATSEDGARLEIGVGSHDRQLFQMINGQSSTVENLTNVVQFVSKIRGDRTAHHPLNRLAQERYLREMLIVNPHLIDANHLERAEPPVARTNLKDATPCVAIGRKSGADLVAVCSAIADPDLVPFAADARLAVRPNAELVLVVAPNNVFPSMKVLASSLHHRASFAVVDENRL